MPAAEPALGSGPAPALTPTRIPYQLLLASASPARLATLRRAGIEPQVRVSAVDEDRALAAAGPLTAPELVLALARAKAEDVARALPLPDDAAPTPSPPSRAPEHPRVGGSSIAPSGPSRAPEHPRVGGSSIAPSGLSRAPEHPRVGAPPDFIVGCDSMLELDGAVMGKPADAAVARERWRSMRGRSGLLHTGHWLIDLRPGAVPANRGVGAVATTKVHFADLDDDELDAYIASGEPLKVAGAFTIDGLGGPYISGIEGDHHNVVGISLPLLRELLAGWGVAIHEFWPPHLRAP